HHLVSLVDVAGVPHLAEQPPHALDVGVVERPVRVVGVEPHADALGERLEVGDVALHRLTAQAIELADPVRLDLVLVVDAELLLERDEVEGRGDGNEGHPGILRADPSRLRPEIARYDRSRPSTGHGNKRAGRCVARPRRATTIRRSLPGEVMARAAAPKKTTK